MNEKNNLMNTRELLIAWREHNNKNALTQIVTQKRGLVVSIARDYLNNGLSLEELKSAGYEGLINAINTFDYNENKIEEFDEYLKTYIERSIKRDINEYNKHNQIISIEEQIENDMFGYEMKDEVIIGNDEEQLIDEVISEIKNDVLRESLQSLTSREKKIIFLRYAFDENHSKTQEELAKMFGCSRASICNQERKALIKMRHQRSIKNNKSNIDE